MGVENALIELPGKYQDLTFRTAFAQNGVAELSASMAPSGGGSATDPAYRWIGGDADTTDWDTWDYPSTPITPAYQAGGGAITEDDGSPCLGSNDDSVLFDGNAYYLQGDTTEGNVSTDDIVAELLFRATGTTSVIAAKRNAGVGWEIGIDASDRLYLTIEDAGGAVTTVSAVLTADCWYYAIIFADRSGNCQIYVNGDASGAAVDISGSNLTLDAAVALALGADSAGNTPFDSALAYFALWHDAAWLTSHLNPDTAAERFGLLAGYWPQVAKGTSAPNVSTRAYAAYLEKIESSKTRLYYVGSEWLRLSERVDGNSEQVTGYLPESEAKNDFDESNDFSGWAKEDAGDTCTDDQGTGPDNLTSMAELICDNTAGNHGISDATPGNLSAVNHCMSVYVAPGNADFVKLTNTTVANAHAWFRLSTGTVGTTGAGISEAGFVEGTYNGQTNCRRPYIRFTGTAAPHTFLIRPCDADNNDNFTAGDGAAVSLYLYGAQCEDGGYPTSYIPTDGATASRLKDQLQYDGDNLGGVGSEQRGTIECDILRPDYDAVATRYIVCLSDGGSAVDNIELKVSSADSINVDTRATAGNNGDANSVVDVVDGIRHRSRCSYATDDLRLYTDGTQDAQDVTCDMPDDLDEIDIGQGRPGGAQFNGLISDLKIWKRNKRR